MSRNLIPFLGLALMANVAQARHTYHELELADGSRLRPLPIFSG